jgi:hypothetical protein
MMFRASARRGKTNDPTPQARLRRDLWSIRREGLLRARLIEEAIAAEAKAVRRDERENTARGSKGERKRSEETLTKASAKEDWQAMVVPDPAFYLKDNGYRK